MSWDGQNDFVTVVLQDEILRKYPVLPQYLARLLKAYLEDLSSRDCDCEVHEDLLSAYLAVAHAGASKTVQSILPHQDNVEEVFFTFELPKGALIPMKQRVEFTDVSQKMWPAAVVLAEYFMQNQGVTKGKRVLELGAGVGFTGIVLSMGKGRSSACSASFFDIETSRRMRFRHSVRLCREWAGAAAHQRGARAVSAERRQCCGRASVAAGLERCGTD